MKKSDNKGRRKLALTAYLLMKKAGRYLPPGLRFVLGLLLVMAGLLGFLPILGFWMIPLGVAVLATDVPPLKRWVRRQLAEIRVAQKKP